jgi:hypothetical protein
VQDEEGVGAESAGGQVLSDIGHGSDVPERRTPAHRMFKAGRPAQEAPQGGEILFETRFGYLFPQLKDRPAAHLPADDPASVVAGLKALGEAMVEDPPAAGDTPLQANGNSTIPPVYTYWGQFIDHDLTANTDRDSSVSDITKPDLKPIPPDEVVEKLFNLRQPTVNLDSVYGDGPTFHANRPTQARALYDGIKFRIGSVALNPPPPAPQAIPGVPIPPDRLEGPDNTFVAVDPLRDLPRIGSLIDAGVVKAEDFTEELRNRPNFRQTALIADARNDENLIVAQLHVAFLRFHNNVVDWLKAHQPRHGHEMQSERDIFRRARQLTRWHHQWLVVNDFLKTITMAGTADKVLRERGRHYSNCHRPLFMPLEFSVAAYRFGHTMVRGAYDHNRNFGRPEAGQSPVINSAPFNLLFSFTGKATPPFRGGSDVLPFNWIIEWDRFVDKHSPQPDRFARKIDTRLAPPLTQLLNEGNSQNDPQIKAVLKHLAKRNLLRGYLLSLPTGQGVAQVMDVRPLSEEELKRGNSEATNKALTDNGFLTRTPLWYYVLKEAEVRAGGNSLGEIGSRIVCETIIGQLLHDPDSYLSRHQAWTPDLGVRLPGGEQIRTIRDFFRFAGLAA